ncbi:MAG: NADP oxidoreductase [Candidatus Fischerbacteria bacterium RBG_13_37_8]|uniref:NADP oxidoreductase n=1 Tax=Candidatus Fischerbacteria bacterium RBG_13_37_8 TaxID=1817863 RepID=A0A1F5VPE4_9BACT|nr:MAG: NADP oxidoreductase [Candidatus Fischerbacteria bacterium RBG_13_37_8]
MGKLSIEDLAKIKEESKRKMNLRDGEYKAKINVHMGTCGIAAGARTIVDALLREIEKKDIKEIMVTTSGCAGLCSREPMATVEIKGGAPVKYADLTEAKIIKILNEHALAGKVVKEYALAVGSEKTTA